MKKMRYLEQQLKTVAVKICIASIIFATTTGGFIVALMDGEDLRNTFHWENQCQRSYEELLQLVRDAMLLTYVTIK